jgi:hypothetical protein
LPVLHAEGPTLVYELLVHALKHCSTGSSVHFAHADPPMHWQLGSNLLAFWQRAGEPYTQLQAQSPRQQCPVLLCRRTQTDKSVRHAIRTLSSMHPLRQSLFDLRHLLLVSCYPQARNDSSNAQSSRTVFEQRNFHRHNRRVRRTRHRRADAAHAVATVALLKLTGEWLEHAGTLRHTLSWRISVPSLADAHALSQHSLVVEEEEEATSCRGGEVQPSDAAGKSACDDCAEAALSSHTPQLVIIATSTIHETTPCHRDMGARMLGILLPLWFPRGLL